jgi:hypothetical protein
MVDGCDGGSHEERLFWRSYIGSAACRACHREIYDRWSKTRTAKVVHNPAQHPDAIIPDLSKTDPLVSLTKSDIAFVSGSKWKQRYFKRVGDDYLPLPAQWDVMHQVWRAPFPCNPERSSGFPSIDQQLVAAHGTIVRRLPFSELQHPNEDSDREVPWTRRRTGSGPPETTL